MSRYNAGDLVVQNYTVNYGPIRTAQNTLLRVIKDGDAPRDAAWNLYEEMHTPLISRAQYEDAEDLGDITMEDQHVSPWIPGRNGELVVEIIKASKDRFWSGNTIKITLETLIDVVNNYNPGGPCE